MNRYAVRILTVLAVIASTAATEAGDWPMWRYDSSRSAASPEELPNEVQLRWSRQFRVRKQAWDDPLNLDLMQYDRILEPIVSNGRLIVSFNDRDKVAAFDLATGQELWSAYADAPVRLPPVAADGRVYYCSDDGYLYCVALSDGRQLWKFRGGPGAQQAIGNQRFTSAWPARGGAVVRDGTVYFAASIWPFMGTFLYAIDGESGRVVWVNDSTGSQYIKQPHSAPSFAGVAPQGSIVATEDWLVVPGGRSVPAVFNRSDGTLKYFELNAGGKGTGGSFVVADSQHFFVHTRERGTRAFSLADGKKTAFMPSEPVLSDGLIYSAETDKEKMLVRCYGDDHKALWEIAADGSGDLIRSGGKLYAAGGGKLTAIQLPAQDAPARVVWQKDGLPDISRLLTADGRLIAVSDDGQVRVFSDVQADAAGQVSIAKTQPLEPGDSAKQRVAQLLDGVDLQGYAIWFGRADGELIQALAAENPFHQMAVVDSDAKRALEFRRSIESAGLYGSTTVHHAEPRDYQPPKYVCHLVVIDQDALELCDDASLRRLYQSVRPYGGELILLTDGLNQDLAERCSLLDLEQCKVQPTNEGVRLTRVGALPGAADWTHQHGDVANTIKSNDSRVKLPLGILWFGGSSNMDVLPRHGHGPPEQVIGGRLFIQGMNSLSARDVYTGRVLWKREFEDLGTFDVYFDKTFKDTPLDPAYNQVHIPGANGRGTNYVATEDRIYLVEHSSCHILSPVTGETLRTISLPATEQGEQPEWGYIGVYKDVLLGGVGFANYRDRHGLVFEEDEKLKSSRAGFGSKSLDRAGSMALVGYDRYSGKELWRADANASFWHNGVIAGNDRVYCLDRTPKPVEDRLKRRGKTPSAGHRILCLNYRTGEPLWEIKENIFGTWLGLSEEDDLLLQAGASASDRLSSEVGRGMAVFDAATGKTRWRKDNMSYAGPCILHNEWIITNANSYSESAGAFHIEDGSQKMVANPLTGELQPWKITRAYGCNNIIASENLLTFRSGAAGFYDMLTNSGTGNIGGFKSGCTSNLVVANGVLNAPDYTRTCSCAYQNQTSLALVHMPEIEMWTVNQLASMQIEKSRIEHLGINFGAPGDRRDRDGNLWLEFPVVAGASPPVEIELNDGAEPYLNHSSTIDDSEWNWVHSSGVKNMTKLRIGLDLNYAGTLAEGVPVQHADDDAEENEEGKVGLGSSDLELVADSGIQFIGLRFRNLDIPRGSKVRSAWIQFTCDEPSTGPANLAITAEDTGDAEVFSDSDHDVSSRTRTKSEVAWNPPDWEKAGESKEPHRTPDLTRLVQEVIERPDWHSGNSMVFMISGSGKRIAKAAKGRASQSAARLVMDLKKADDEPEPPESKDSYEVRLLFAAPDAVAAQPPEFGLRLQGELVAPSISFQMKSDGTTATLEKTFAPIRAGRRLTVELIPKSGETAISGIELHRLSSSPDSSE